MNKVKFTLNDKTVEAEQGLTILEAARRLGTVVPTLCNDERLKPTAACRICLVRVSGARGPVPACATPVAEGMVVHTDTEDLVKSRRLALELMLSDHYGDCIAPCKMACPANIDIQGYIGLIANGLYVDALKLIKESNPLPLICGRVCPRFCEKQCRRNLVDGPVAINWLKRFAADYAFNNNIDLAPQIKPATGYRVAIIGGGPAGLSAAYYLALEGHSVTIYESSQKLGGMMRYGIPAYRLPRNILDYEISTITKLCQKVVCNAELGRDFTLESLRSDGYQAIFVAIGAQADQRMNIEGEELSGVHSGIGFLREIALGHKVPLGKRVAVVGGGNTAIDAAQTAVRLGCEDVTIVYRRTKEEMPASEDEIKQAEDKGVKFHFLAAPLKLNSNGGQVENIECIRMSLGEPDSSGRRRPEPIVGSEFNIALDNVIMAIGQSVKAPDTGGILSMEKGGIRINKDTMLAADNGIFAGGDCATGPATVVEAVAAGKRAATSICKYLQGESLEPLRKPYNCSKGTLKEINPREYEEVQRIPRVEMPTRDPKIRLGFDEFELGFSENLALIEAGRCLSCGCQKAFDCTLRDLATEYEVNTVKFMGDRHNRKTDTHDHPNILREPNKCILCGRCVRICSEVVGLGALGFVNRGFETQVQPALGLQLIETNCNSCGECTTTCPTGAILQRVNLPKAGPWKLHAVPTVCSGCGIGCAVQLNVKGDKLVKVTPAGDARINGNNICEKGMFDPIAINGQKRLSAPLVLRGETAVEASWEEAFETAAHGLIDIKEKKGADSLAVIVSPRATNEEAFLAQKLARMGLGTNNICSPDLPFLNEGFLRFLGKDGSCSNFDDLNDCDLIMSFNCELEYKYPVTSFKVREAMGRGCKLITLGSRQTSLDLMARINLKVNRRTSLDVLTAMLIYLFNYNLLDHDYIKHKVNNFAEMAAQYRGQPLTLMDDIPWVNTTRLIEALHLYVRARKPVILVDGDIITDEEAALISQLALVTGNIGREGSGIIQLRQPCNAQGLLDMGVVPAYLPGQVNIDSDGKGIFETNWGGVLPAPTKYDAAQVMDGIRKGKIAGMLLIDNNTSWDGLDIDFTAPVFSVVVTSAVPGSGPYPSVVLPSANFTANEGTYTNCEGFMQKLNPAFAPDGVRKTWEILAALSSSLGHRMYYRSVAEITSEITEYKCSCKSELTAA